MKHLQFGAGNIGRSFIGQLFAQAGYEVVFVDVDEELIALLNQHRRYPVEIRDKVCETIWVEGVRAISGRDVERVAEEFATADTAATAVGATALPHLYPAIAAGLEKRLRTNPTPINIIICENLRHAAAVVRDGLKQLLPADFPLEEMVGLVETSIGKMVPIITEEQRRQNPLAVYAEAYNTLICDRRGFKGPLPPVPQLDPKDNMKAYVDRKLFIHNLGHAVTAYVGFVKNPTMKFIWEAVECPAVRQVAYGAMVESAAALACEYPGEFTHASLREHIEDLLSRFANKALGDTIYRVGRDLPRKLAPDDRLIGALQLDLKHDIDPRNTILGIAAAFHFRATDEHGELFPADAEFLRRVERDGVRAVLCEHCALDEQRKDHAEVIEQILAAFRVNAHQNS